MPSKFVEYQSYALAVRGDPRTPITVRRSWQPLLCPFTVNPHKSVLACLDAASQIDQRTVFRNSILGHAVAGRLQHPFDHGYRCAGDRQPLEIEWDRHKASA